MHNILKVSGWSKGWLVVIDQTKALYDQSQYYVADYSYPRHDYRAKLYLTSVARIFNRFKSNLTFLSVFV